MDVKSVPETREERLIRSFMAGAEDEMRAIRGRGFSETERIEFEEIAREMYGPAPVETVTAA